MKGLFAFSQIHCNCFHLSIKMSQFEALYRKKSKAPIGCNSLEKIVIISLELLQAYHQHVKVIRDWLKEPSHHQKGYMNAKRTPTESPSILASKKNYCFVLWYKWNPVTRVTCWLTLPPSLLHINNAFNMALLKRSVNGPHHIIIDSLYGSRMKAKSISYLSIYRKTQISYKTSRYDNWTCCGSQYGKYGKLGRWEWPS